jgi:protoheme ferro-lyase
MTSTGSDHFTADTGDTWKASLSQLMQETAMPISYHSIPNRYVEAGADYPQQCETTTPAPQAFLEHEKGDDFAGPMVNVCHSQMGGQPWLCPKAAEAVTALPLPPGTERKRAFSEE